MLKTALVRKRDVVYPRPPFDPPVVYPELTGLGLTQADPDNQVYAMVRRCFELMGLDRENAGSPTWNPLADLIDSRSRVVVKPNFVQHYDHAGCLDQLVTHPSVLRPILDYLLLAQGSLDRVDVVDSPEISCRFDLALERLGWRPLEELYDSLGHRLRILDIRTEWADYREGGAIVDRHRLPGDPKGFVRVDLGERSELAPIAGSGSFYGADYDRKWTNRNHTTSVNRYVVSRTFLESDLVISVPKLKTHKKAGLTCSMKNLVGMNGDKNLLPHYTVGDALVGGCEYSQAPTSVLQRLSRSVDRFYRDRFLASRSSLAGKVYNRLEPLRDLRSPLTDAQGQIKGDWWGNDVIWRTIVDLNRILRYAGARGELAASPVRKQLAVVDAIVSGEGEGPHHALPRKLGAILGGMEGPLVDTLAAALMGFDATCIPQLSGAVKPASLPLVSGASPPIVQEIDDRVLELPLSAFPGPNESFQPPAGWVGHVELDRAVGA
jgi:uncharacterized protein (DUF362 family)